MTDWQAEALRYKDRLDVAEERIRQLLDLMRPKAVFPPEWGLTPGEARFLAALGLRGDLTKDAAGIAAALNVDSDRLDLQLLARTTVFRVRAKVGPFGIKIGTAWGRGYYLIGNSREIIKTALRVADDVEKNEQTRERTAQDENLPEY